MEQKSKGWESALSKLPDDLARALILHTPLLLDTCYEICLRASCPVTLLTSSGRRYLTENGCLVRDPLSQKTLIVRREDLKAVLLKLCSYSVYSYQRQINSGYITVGGCRAGICGSAVLSDGQITSVKNITSINIRIARECIGCADELIKSVDPLKGVLICGAPSTGKTTLLRDIARSLSYRYKVSLIDERNELSASDGGAAVNDIGLCDVYVNYPKSIAIEQAVRAMSPDIIICDELGDEKELDSLCYALFCGAAFIGTVHSESSRRDVVKRLLHTGAFSYLVMLDNRQNAGKIREITCLS